MNKYQEAWENILNRRESLFELNAFTVKQILLEVPTQTPMTDEVNLIQELVDRATPKKPIVRANNSVVGFEDLCPNCGAHLLTSFISKADYQNCHKCGQKFDWENK